MDFAIGEGVSRTWLNQAGPGGHGRTPWVDGTGPAGGGPRRLTGARRLSLRTVLLIVVFVPSLTFAPLLASGMHQLATQWQAEKTQMELATTAVGRPAADLFLSLDQERRLTAQVLAGPGSPARDQLAEQRAVTDRAVRAFRPLTALDDADAQEGLTDAVIRTDRGLGLLDQQRRAVDAGRATSQRAFDYYSGVLESALSVLTALGNTDEGQVSSKAQTLTDLFWVVYALGREDALLSGGWARGALTRSEYGLVTDAIGARKHLLRSRVLPALTGNELPYAKMTTGKAWETMAALEGRLITAGSGAEGDRVTLRDDSAQWRSAVDAVTVQLRQLLSLRSENVGRAGYGHADMIFKVFVSISTVGLLALGLVFFTSWRLTAVLRRRILALRQDAQELQERLPDVVARLERGEDVDVDAEVRRLEPTPDELGELGQALNLASRSAVHTAVRQAEQHRGFQRMLQRIARRTQILIGLQLKKLDELERKHEDPEVLEGLFDLDHLTSRLRRYEENLVILGGGQPQRRWRKPVRAARRAARRARRGPGLPPDLDRRRGRALDRGARGATAGPRPGGAHGERHRLLQAADPRRGPGRAGRPGRRRGDRGPRPGHGARAVRRRQRPAAVAAAPRRAGPRRRRAARPVRGRPALREPGPPGRAAAVRLRRHPGHRAGSRIAGGGPPPHGTRARHGPHGGPPGRRRLTAPPTGGNPAARGRRTVAGPLPRTRDGVRHSAGSGSPEQAVRRRGRCPSGYARPAWRPSSRSRRTRPTRPARRPGRTQQPSRSGATIGAFQRQSRKRRTGDDASQPAASGSPEPSSPTTEDR